jgi:hypothetical protein
MDMERKISDAHSVSNKWGYPKNGFAPTASADIYIYIYICIYTYLYIYIHTYIHIYVLHCSTVSHDVGLNC